jgi:hypothetical protein
VLQRTKAAAVRADAVSLKNAAFDSLAVAAASANKGRHSSNINDKKTQQPVYNVEDGHSGNGNHAAHFSLFFWAKKRIFTRRTRTTHRHAGQRILGINSCIDLTRAVQ